MGMQEPAEGNVGCRHPEFGLREPPATPEGLCVILENEGHTQD